MKFIKVSRAIWLGFVLFYQPEYYFNHPAEIISNVSVRLRQASSRPVFKVIFSNENRSATPSATDVTPTRFNQLGSGLSNVAARGEGSRPIPPVAPTLENERFYGAADLYGVSGRPSADNIQQDRIGYCFSLLMLEL